MKKSTLLPSFAVIGLLLVAGCSNNKEGDRIQELEEKITQLERNQLATPANAQSVTPVDPSSVGQFDFEEVEFDFGTINEGHVVEHEFKFTNSGQAPLIISNVQASCGCTTPDWTKTPIKPGEGGFVKVSFNSTARTGVQSPTVSIQANTSPNITRVRLKGTVTPKSGSSPALGPVRK